MLLVWQQLLGSISEYEYFNLSENFSWKSYALTRNDDDNNADGRSDGSWIMNLFRWTTFKYRGTIQTHGSRYAGATTSGAFQDFYA